MVALPQNLQGLRFLPIALSPLKMSVLVLMIHGSCKNGSQHICIPGKKIEEKIHKNEAKKTAGILQGSLLETDTE